MTQVVNPLGRQVQGFRALAPRPRDLNGLTVGLLWNSKANADVYLRLFEKFASQRFPDVRFETFVKEGASVPPDESMMARLAECDAVVTAFGD